MQSIVITEPKTITLKNVPAPAPQPGETLLKMTTGGICGSDLGVYRGTMAYGAYPRIPGHEFSTEILEIRGDSHGFAVGQLVTGNPYFNCGKCYSCRRGFVNCCMDNKTMGVQRDGAFSEFFTMPTTRLIAGKGLSADTLALVEPFGISYHGVNRAEVKPGERVLIIGAGTIGILALFAAKLKGTQVYVCDVSQTKLDNALQFGADGVLLNTGQEDFLQRVDELTGGDGFDVTIEAVGLPSTFQNAVDAAAYRARVILIGIGKASLDFQFTAIQKKELSIMGSRNAFTHELEELVELVGKENINLESIISKRYPFAEAKQAFNDFDTQQGSMLKVLLNF